MNVTSHNFLFFSCFLLLVYFTTEISESQAGKTKKLIEINLLALSFHLFSFLGRGDILPVSRNLFADLTPDLAILAALL
jgi:hypothetical protein